MKLSRFFFVSNENKIFTPKKIKGGMVNMSFFSKVLASVGIGSAKVDTKLHKSSFTAGEEVTGVVEITGGDTEQRIDEIHLYLFTDYISKSSENEKSYRGVIVNHTIVDHIMVGPNEVKEIPFSFQLPIDTPMTMGRTKVWLHTAIDIKSALDPTDNDFITVKGLPITQAVLSAVQSLGFRLREVENEETSRFGRASRNFVQEFEFVPTSGQFKGKLDELELVFTPISRDVVDVAMQVDRKATSLFGAIAEYSGLDETNLRFTVTNADIPNLSSKIYDTIKKYS